MIYRLLDGTRVRVTDSDVDGSYDFETYRFTPEKETLRVETLAGEEAVERVSALRVDDSIRFARQYGGGAVGKLDPITTAQGEQIVEEFGRIIKLTGAHIRATPVPSDADATCFEWYINDPGMVNRPCTYISRGEEAAKELKTLDREARFQARLHRISGAIERSRPYSDALAIVALLVLVVGLFLAPNPDAPDSPPLPGVTSTSSATPGE